MNYMTKIFDHKNNTSLIHWSFAIVDYFFVIILTFAINFHVLKSFFSYFCIEIFCQLIVFIDFHFALKFVPILNA